MKRRSGVVLILVLIVMLIGGAFVYAAFSMAENAHNSSMNMVTQDRLYNAAQSGLEWGKTILWIYRADLESDLISDVDSLEDLYARKDDGSEGTLGNVLDYGLMYQDKYPDGTMDLPEGPSFSNPEVHLDVQILDCNYKLAEGASVVNLPPLKERSKGSEGNSGGGSQIGFSNLLDPNRNISMGGGTGTVRHAFVIRSIARVSAGTSDERRFGVETMVVISHE